MVAPRANSSHSVDALRQMIESLGAQMQNSFNQINGKMDNLDERMRKMENQEAGCRPVVDNQIAGLLRAATELGNTAALHERRIQVLEKNNIEDLVTRMKTLEDKVSEIKPVSSFLKWIGALAGGSAILWILSQFLGKIAGG